MKISEFKKLDNVDVYVDGKEIVIIGIPGDDEDDENEEDGHNCDYMGCNSMEHILYRAMIWKR